MLEMDKCAIKKNIKKGKNVSVHFHSKDDDGGDDKKSVF